MLNDDGTKRCPACELSLPPTSFYKVSRAQGDGLSGRCRACTKAAAIAWQRANPDAKSAADKRRHEKDKADAAKRALRAAYMREYNAHPSRREARAEYERTKNKAWKKAHPEEVRIINALHNNSYRARKLGRECTFVRVHWYQVLDAFNYQCAFCGAQGALLDLEHLVAFAQGGHHVPGNVVCACRPCNAQKSGRTLEEFQRIRPFDLEAVKRKLQYAHGTGPSLSLSSRFSPSNAPSSAQDNSREGSVSH